MAVLSEKAPSRALRKMYAAMEARHDLAQPTLRHFADDVAAGVRELLDAIGEDPAREGLRDTPARVVKAFLEMTEGYLERPEEILSTQFDLSDVEDEDGVESEYRGAVALRDIEFTSLCEHHMLPFVGRAHVMYIPGEAGRVVGLSKLARLVDCYARRLQVQERLTQQIASALLLNLAPLGAAVVIEAEHMCMKLRGVQKQQSKMVTTALLGCFKEDHRARDEALATLLGRP